MNFPKFEELDKVQVVVHFLEWDTRAQVPASKLHAAYLSLGKWLRENKERGYGSCAFCVYDNIICCPCTECPLYREGSGSCRRAGHPFSIWLEEGKTEAQADAVLLELIKIYKDEWGKEYGS